MAFKGITELIKNVPILSEHDTVRRAAGLIRASDSSEILVSTGGRIFGNVSEKAITEFLASSQDSDRAAEQPIGPLVSSSPVTVNFSISIQEASQIFAQNGVDMLPVIDNFGGFHGVLFRRDVVAVLTNNLRPPSVGGMATPLGVYLTTGSVSGGVGNLGLILSGATLMSMFVVAWFVVLGLQELVSIFTKIPLSAFLNSQPLTMNPNLYDLLTYGSWLLTVVTMFLLLRLSSVAGFHAAEHMTVHAIEAGEALTPENVRPMPRVHPRCGTNLMAGATVFTAITQKFGNQYTVLIAFAVVVLGWRTIGGWLQHFFTTKTPTQKQLESGVAAGNELLAKYREQPNCQLAGFEKVWRMGFLQMFIGMAAVISLMALVQKLGHLPPWLMPF